MQLILLLFFFLTFLLLYYKHTNRSLKHSKLKWKNCNFKTAPGKIFNFPSLSLKSCINKQHCCKPPLACGSSDERAPHRSGYPRARWGTYLVKNKFCEIFPRVERPHVKQNKNNFGGMSNIQHSLSSNGANIWLNLSFTLNLCNSLKFRGGWKVERKGKKCSMDTSTSGSALNF